MGVGGGGDERGTLSPGVTKLQWQLEALDARRLSQIAEIVRADGIQLQLVESATCHRKELARRYAKGWEAGVEDAIYAKWLREWKMLAAMNKTSAHLRAELAGTEAKALDVERLLWIQHNGSSERHRHWAKAFRRWLKPIKEASAKPEFLQRLTRGTAEMDGLVVTRGEEPPAFFWEPWRAVRDLQARRFGVTASELKAALGGGPPRAAPESADQLRLMNRALLRRLRAADAEVARLKSELNELR